MITKIRNDNEYKQVMYLIVAFIHKATKHGGFHTLTKKENHELKQLSVLAESYEDKVIKIMPLPVTIEEIVQQNIKEKKITQRSLAQKFGMSTSKISQILNGQRPPDVAFLKAVHEKLGVDGNLILEVI